MALSYRAYGVPKGSTPKGSTLGFRQGSYRSWKTWKVMEFRNFISRPGKSWNLIVGP